MSRRLWWGANEGGSIRSGLRWQPLPLRYPLACRPHKHAHLASDCFDIKQAEDGAERRYAFVLLNDTRVCRWRHCRTCTRCGPVTREREHKSYQWASVGVVGTAPSLTRVCTHFLSVTPTCRRPRPSCATMSFGWPACGAAARCVCGVDELTSTADHGVAMSASEASTTQHERAKPLCTLPPPVLESGMPPNKVHHQSTAWPQKAYCQHTAWPQHQSPTHGQRTQ